MSSYYSDGDKNVKVFDGVDTALVSSTGRLLVDAGTTGGIGASTSNVVRIAEKYTGAQTDTVLLSVETGDQFVVTSISILCAGSNSVDVSALLEFDGAPDVRILEHPGIKAGSGPIEGNGGGILAVGGDAQDLLFTCSAPTAGSITVHVSGFII